MTDHCLAKFDQSNLFPKIPSSLNIFPSCYQKTQKDIFKGEGIYLAGSTQN